MLCGEMSHSDTHSTERRFEWCSCNPALICYDNVNYFSLLSVLHVDGGGDESHLNVEPDENGEVTSAELFHSLPFTNLPRVL